MGHRRTIWQAQYPRRAHGTASFFMLSGVLGAVPLTMALIVASCTSLAAPMFLFGITGYLLLWNSFKYMQDRQLDGGLGIFWTSQALFHAAMAMMCMSVVRMSTSWDTIALSALSLVPWFLISTACGLFGLQQDTQA